MTNPVTNPVTNPKAEIRDPKEIRRPKSEYRCSEDQGESWESAESAPGQAFVLRENESAINTAPNLMERVARFGEAIIRFSKKIPRGPIYPENNRLIEQLVGAGTSVGANYCEADDSSSGKDFKNKICICRKESKEAMFFLRMVASSEEGLGTEARKLWREAKELNLIFGAIWRKQQ